MRRSTTQGVPASPSDFLRKTLHTYSRELQTSEKEELLLLTYSVKGNELD